MVSLVSTPVMLRNSDENDSSIHQLPNDVESSRHDADPVESHAVTEREENSLITRLKVVTLLDDVVKETDSEARCSRADQPSTVPVICVPTLTTHCVDLSDDVTIVDVQLKSFDIDERQRKGSDCQDNSENNTLEQIIERLEAASLDSDGTTTKTETGYRGRGPTNGHASVRQTDDSQPTKFIRCSPQEASVAHQPHVTVTTGATQPLPATPPWSQLFPTGTGYDAGAGMLNYDFSPQRYQPVHDFHAQPSCRFLPAGPAGCASHNVTYVRNQCRETNVAQQRFFWGDFSRNPPPLYNGLPCPITAGTMQLPYLPLLSPDDVDNALKESDDGASQRRDKVWVYSTQENAQDFLPYSAPSPATYQYSADMFRSSQSFVRTPPADAVRPVHMRPTMPPSRISQHIGGHVPVNPPSNEQVPAAYSPLSQISPSPSDTSQYDNYSVPSCGRISSPTTTSGIDESVISLIHSEPSSSGSYSGSPASSTRDDRERSPSVDSALHILPTSTVDQLLSVNDADEYCIPDTDELDIDCFNTVPSDTVTSIHNGRTILFLFRIVTH